MAARLLLFASLALLASAEIQQFHLLLPATSTSIHYTDLYLRGPGSVDVSQLVITSVSEAHNYNLPSQDDDYEEDDDDGDYEEDDDEDLGDDDAEDDDKEDDDAGDEGDDGQEGEQDDKVDVNDDEPKAATNDTSGGKGNDGGGLRWQRLKEHGGGKKSRKHRNLVHSQKRTLDDDSRTFIDFVAFKLPASCANTKAGCDWTALGVGAKHADGTLRWCCSPDAVALGLCTGGDDLGRLIVDGTKLPGKKRQIAIQNTGDVEKTVNNGLIPEEESGQYVLIMANCNDGGRDVMVTGEAAYKSEHGYLPGELWGFLYFFAAMTIAYFVIFLWYGIAMHLNEESRIPIEKWILTTIVLGLSEMVFKTGDAFVWNESGYRQMWICYTGIILGVVKRGWSRSLIVMVSLGWGVTCDSLGRRYKWIFLLCMFYIGVSSFCDLTIVIAVTEMEVLSENVETDLYDIYTILTFIIAAVDVIYVMWILDALADTMEQLESKNQSRKLKRYLRLRCLFLFAVLFAAAWAMFAVANAYTDGIVGEEDSWIVDGATELNYLIVMIGVACLWRPSPSAREYAYAMELPSMNYDGDGAELELSGVNVPSAMDSDDEEYDDGFVDTKPGRKTNGFRDEPSQRTIT